MDWLDLLAVQGTRKSLLQHPSSKASNVITEYVFINYHFKFKLESVTMPFSQIIPPSPSPTESKRLFYTSVSLLLSRTLNVFKCLGCFYLLGFEKV